MVEGEVRVTVNGRGLYVRRAVLPYGDVLGLAGYGPLSGSARPRVTVTYPPRWASLDGPLGPGGSAVVRPGMALTVGA